VTIIFYKQFLSDVDPFIINFFQSAFGAIFIGAFDFYFGTSLFPGEALYFWLVLYTAVAGASVGFTLWFVLLRKEDAIVISGSSFLVPLVALFSGWIFLKENVSIESILGAILVLFGVLLVNKPNKRNHS
ncbi:MAG: DMT family transporter, partial [Candidatus Bathyarchaeia archaeon]